MKADKAEGAYIDFTQQGNTIELKSSGNWTLEQIAHIDKKLKSLFRECNAGLTVRWDVSQTYKFDSAGILLFMKYYDLLKKRGCNIEVVGVQEDQKQMYNLLRKNLQKSQIVPKGGRFFEDIGKNVYAIVQDILYFLAFLGESFLSFCNNILHPSSMRYKAIIKNIEDAGVKALPIIAVTSFLIGVVVAYQSAVQLEKFGANIFIVDMIGISVSRELSPLITAIVVAGRSGSSYTAQIGAMKITQELDAMKTMGFDPFNFLVTPRIIALMIAMPLMIFFSDIIGIFGGMFISKIQINLSYTEFINRLQIVLESKHLWIGIVKGPFFAWFIASIGCFRGFQVLNTTESIGRYTTISVVNSIFLVIACDALFSVFFTELGI